MTTAYNLNRIQHLTIFFLLSSQGCYNALIDWIMYNRNLVIIVAIGVGLVQLLAIFLSFCLCKSIEKYRGMRL